MELYQNGLGLKNNCAFKIHCEHFEIHNRVSAVVSIVQGFVCFAFELCSTQYAMVATLNGALLYLACIH